MLAQAANGGAEAASTLSDRTTEALLGLLAFLAAASGGVAKRKWIAALFQKKSDDEGDGERGRTIGPKTAIELMTAGSGKHDKEFFDRIGALERRFDVADERERIEEKVLLRLRDKTDAALELAKSNDKRISVMEAKLDNLDEKADEVRGDLKDVLRLLRKGE